MECIEVGGAADPPESFLSAALRGLREVPKAIPPKFLYDRLGSSLFEEICRQPEYYPTRTEIAILRENVAEIAAEIPRGGFLVELGSGASVKTEILLDVLVGKIGAYVPFDISKSFLLESADRLKKRYPSLEILPICGDFSAGIRLPESVFAAVPSGSRTAFLPGSTLGNFDPDDALVILESIRGLAGRLLIGIDLAKDPELLEAAYNDAAGVTAQFNKNILTRLARETGVSLDPDDFLHEAFYRDSLNRIEMHLVARRRVKLRIGAEEFKLSPGESIHTENSYKYTPEGFERLARRAGFETLRCWTDPEKWFAVFLLAGAKVPDQRLRVVGDDSVHLHFE